jgi:Arc/MetJ family transcription regulator
MSVIPAQAGMKRQGRRTMPSRRKMRCVRGVRCVYFAQFIHIGQQMRTNIDIDDRLVNEAMAALGLKTKKATVEEALRRAVQQNKRRRALDELTGIGWEGDLDAMRAGRVLGPHG